MIRIDNTWARGEAVHPLDILRSEMEARAMNQAQLAELIEMKPSNLSRLFRQRGDITASLALRLEQALGIPAEHWVGMQVAYYRDTLLGLAKTQSSAKPQRLSPTL